MLSEWCVSEAYLKHDNEEYCIFSDRALKSMHQDKTASKTNLLNRSKAAMEYLVLDRKTQGNDLTQVEFGLHGDPGSLVINRFYEVCGP